MLIELLWAQARERPGKPAFIHNGLPCSHAAFARRIARACEQLAGLGLPAGGVAVLALDDLAQCWVAGIALRHLGLTTVALPHPAGLAALERQLGRPASAVLCGPGDARPEGAARLIVLPADPEPAGDALLPPLPAGAARPGGHILMTSGTTGESKLVLRDPVVEAQTIDLHAEIVGITAASSVYVRDFPQWTAGGYRWPLLSWHQGATVVFQQHGDFHGPLLSPATTHAYATPMTLQFALRSPELIARRNEGLRLLVTGGPMSRALAAVLQQRLTRQLFCMLASTEAATLACTRVDDLDALRWHQVHASREVQVVDEGDAPLPPGQLGRLRVRILDGVAGYLNDEAASREFFREGFFYSGDLAVLHPDGRLELHGRATEVLNVHGHKIASASLEAALQERLAGSGVSAVCLLTRPGPDGEEALHVFLETPRPLSPAALKAGCEPVLGRIAADAHFHQVPALPRNRMGKLMRQVLLRQGMA